MRFLTQRLPDNKHNRFKAMAASQGTSFARLLDEMTTQTLVQFDAETRFKIRAQRGSNQLERGLELLRLAQGSSA